MNIASNMILIGFLLYYKRGRRTRERQKKRRRIEGKLQTENQISIKMTFTCINV